MDTKNKQKYKRWKHIQNKDIVLIKNSVSEQEFLFHFADMFESKDSHLGLWTSHSIIYKITMKNMHSQHVYGTECSKKSGHEWCLNRNKVPWYFMIEYGCFLSTTLRDNMSWRQKQNLRTDHVNENIVFLLQRRPFKCFQEESSSFMGRTERQRLTRYINPFEKVHTKCL